MKAVVAAEFGGGWTVAEVPDPKPAEGQVLVRVLASGVCYTDVHNLENTAYGSTFPRIPGHEVVGEIVELGPGVETFARGEIVGVQWTQGTCRSCRWCLTGREEQCDAALRTGATVDGGHAELALAWVDGLERLPTELDPIEAAPVMCAGYTVYSGLADLDPAPGEHVVVAGIGGLGHLALQYARAMGAETTAVTSSAQKRGLLHELGADHVVDLPDQAAVDQLRAHGIDALLCCGNRVPQPLLSAVVPYGRISLCGVSDERIPLDVTQLIFSKLTIFGSSHGPRGRLREALELHARSKARTLVETFSLDTAPEALQRVREGSVRFRAVLVPESS